MSSKYVRDTITAYLTAAWTDSPIIVVENFVDDLPDPPRDHISLEFPVSDEEPVTFGAPGSNVFRETGSFRVNVSVIAGSGMDLLGTYAATLAALFRDMTIGEVFIRTVNPPVERDDVGELAGNYYTLAVVVDYWYDLLA